jgi:hypothetical protein
MKTIILKPPVVRVDVDAASALIWGTRPLCNHLGELERLLMLDADAPASFDCIPLRSSPLRSKALVEVFGKSFKANPALAPMVTRVAGAIKQDRLERTGHPADSDILESVSQITRQVEVKSGYRPRY